ncbi:MAG: hypothetical protein U5K37_03370 [Natrialbaceae archaeon]|nr:hypothetical protein [Natrialbaceae archaeon]
MAKASASRDGQQGTQEDNQGAFIAATPPGSGVEPAMTVTGTKNATSRSGTERPDRQSGEK